MPYEVVTADVQTAIEALLEADTGLTALLASKPSALGGGPAIYTEGEVPQGAPFRYLTIGAWTQNPFHRFSPDGSGFGWNLTTQLKVVGQTKSAPLVTIMNAVFGVLEQGTPLDVNGYTLSWCDECHLQPALKETLAGVTTISIPAILRVYVT